MSLERLREITGQLPDLSQIISPGCRGYKIRKFECEEGGPCYEQLIHSEEQVAVGRLTAPAGTVVATHVHHEEVEYYIILSGMVRCVMPDSAPEAKVGESIIVPKNTPHSCRIIKDAMFLAITVPAAVGMRLQHQ